MAEAKATAELVGKLARALRVLIWALRRAGPLVKRQAGTPLAYDVPVDSAMDSLTVSLSGTGATVVLVRPDGTDVTAADADAQVATLTTGVLISVTDPAPGVWKLKVTGGELSISVFGTSTLHFDIFRFLRLGGSHHVGFFPMGTTPVPTATVVAEAALDGAFDTVDFELRTLDGVSIAHADENDGPDDDWYLTTYIFCVDA